MMKNKIGSIFLVSMLALAGLGVSYAGFSDIIFVSGTVECAQLDLTVTGYSGTYVWKSITEANPHGIIMTDDPNYVPPNGDTGFQVAFAKARAGGSGEADVVFEFDNLFPCIYFMADFEFTYTGTIPARLWANILTTDQWLLDLYATGEIILQAYVKVDENWVLIDENGYQAHGGEQFRIVITIHIPQDNVYQAKTGSFNAWVGALQWNELPADVGWNWYS